VADVRSWNVGMGDVGVADVERLEKEGRM